MKSPLTALLLSGLAVISGHSEEATPPNSIQLVETFTGLKIDKPISVVVAPDGTGREFLVQQRGKILILPKDRASAEAAIFLDISGRKMEENEFEEGLLGLAFHPKFKENGKFYIYYSQQGPKRSVISEMLVSKDDPSKADTATERVLLEVPQPFWNHNSGNMLFGPDGKLFVCFGDGGKRDDIKRLAQDLKTLNGSVIRLDVDARTEGLEYGIPEDNPFVGVDGARGEIWAYGLRNPWGISIDETGRFWLADVGQDAWEEIDIVERGGNYGWSFMEGMGKFVIRNEDPPEGTEFVSPIHVYSRDKGLSVTGGYVYGGTTAPALKGLYIFGDWASGRIWALKGDEKGEKPESNAVKLFERPTVMETFKPTGFYPGADGEMLVLSWDGKVYEVRSAGDGS